MKKSTKIVVSAAGALIAGLCGSIPLKSFRGYDPAIAAALYGLVMGLAAYLMVWPWRKKREANAWPSDVTTVAERVDLTSSVQGAAGSHSTATSDDHPPPKINKRRLQIIISGVLTAAAAAYAL